MIAKARGSFLRLSCAADDSVVEGCPRIAEFCNTLR